MKSFLFSSFVLLLSSFVTAQVGIGTTSPNASLDVVSTTDGLLIPRVALSDTNVATVLTPTVSELVYNTFTSAAGPNQVTPGYYYWDGSLWIRLATGNSSNAWALLGNAGTSAATNFLGTTDDIDLAFRRNNLAAGKISATSSSFGLGALTANTTGAANVAVGTSALAANITSANNTAVGFNSLIANTAAGNSALGYRALGSNISGTNNTAFGFDAGFALTGSGNIMIGANTVAPVAGSSDQLNIGNTLFGSMAGALTTGVNTTRTIGINNLAPQAALDIISSNNGLLIPRISLTFGANLPQPIPAPADTEMIYVLNSVGTGVNAVTPGFYHWNTATARWVRFNTGASTGWQTTGNTVGGAGSFIGTLDGFDVAFRRSNSAAGFIGANSTALGVSSLAANTGTNNTAFGTNALAANNTPGDNTAIGYNALAANTLNSGAGNLNTAVGSGALDSLNGGARNTAVGANALTGVNGNASLDNVAVGHNALPGVGTITQSVAIGAGALLNSGSGTTRSTAIGYNAGNGLTQSIDNVFIGWSAQGTGSVATNQIAIGSGATASGNNAVRLGNTAIGTISGQVNFTATSDRRWKDNIKDSNLGLEFIKTIRPVSYFRKNDEIKKTEYGFIAQELETAFQNAGDANNAVISKDTEGMYGVRYSDFISISVKAIQEQQDQIEALKKANDELMKTNATILKRLEALESK